jgi:hypothetical protein
LVFVAGSGLALELALELRRGQVEHFSVAHCWPLPIVT